MNQREICRLPNYRREYAKVWTSVVRSAGEAFNSIELASIGTLRTSGFLWIELDDIPAATEAAMRSGMNVLPLVRNGDKYRCAIGKDNPITWYDAWHGEDHGILGQLMGYPECCVDAFQERWIREHRRDWIMTMPGAHDGPWELNPFMYRLGARTTPWIPCSTRCEESLKRARLFLELGQRIGADVGAIESLLRLPSEWDARNGAAIVTTPVFRFVHDTDPDTRGFIKRDGTVCEDYPSYLDNGFKSLQSETEAHATLVEAVGAGAPILDLGAGNGDLVSRCGGGIAVEFDQERVDRGKARNPDIVWVVDRLENTDSWAGYEWETTVLALRRMQELSDEDRKKVRFALRLAKRIIAYTYDGEDVRSLLSASGFRQASPIVNKGTVSLLEVAP